MPARIETLFKKFLDGSCSQQEFNELMDLLRENQHEETVRHMLQQVYQSTARSLKSVTYVDEQGQLQTETASTEAPPTPAAIKMPRRRLTQKLAIAASIIIVITAGIWWVAQKGGSPQPEEKPTEIAVHKTTQRGELKYLVLPDSTQVWLNVASTIDFPETFAKGRREVFLSGEAFFDVKHAEDRPFLIHTGNVVTRVLGTSFNIKAYPGQVDVVVSVKRGKVQVSRNNEVVATLTKGQEVKVVSATSQAAVGSTKENTVAAWTNGRLIYDSRTIQDILQDLERNYNVKIELTDPKLGEEVYTTSFRRDIGVEEALDIICKAIDARLSIEKGIYTIKPN